MNTTPQETDTADTRAAFNPLIRPYLVAQGACILAVTIIGLPLAIIWLLGVGQWWARHYFDKLDCHLDAKKLRYRKGILVTVEKTIPLENIQDVTFIEGPILRHFHLSTLKFETAGSGAGQANDMHLTGIIDAHNFRNRILEARDALKQQGRDPRAAAASSISENEFRVAQLAALHGIERRLDEALALLKERK
ncbi:MAG: PH domain-containing protein [Burkholderiales bacterium]|nr:PH domain-containing protein [Burkholderiales bacterium]